MSNEELVVPVTEPVQAPKGLDFAKVDALRRHMLLTVDSMVKLLGVSRVSYYNWVKGGKMRKPMQDHIRGVTRRLVVCVSQHNWPDDAVYVANQKQRLEMLQNLLETLDKEPT